MTVKTDKIKLQTKGNNDVIGITDKVAQIVLNSGITEGIVTVFLLGSTGGITTIENEPGLIQDFKEVIEKLVPEGSSYRHPDNSFSHILSALFGTSFSCPFSEKRLLLGPWQQIVFVDFDSRPRSREIIVQIVGE